MSIDISLDKCRASLTLESRHPSSVYALTKQIDSGAKRIRKGKWKLSHKSFCSSFRRREFGTDDAPTARRMPARGNVPGGGVRKHVPPCRLLPTAAQRPVKLHETLILVASRLCQSELRVEERSLPVQHFEICSGAALVARDGETDRLFQIRHQLFLLNSYLMEFLVGDQGVRHISEGTLNGLFVRNQSLLVLRFR